ncbi:hypothetical protein GCM10017600_27300 [Streptosporangium carneum]|uniref:Uncharacterized protein n=1 Tax=Streptosporangium carneum TaxID=47481 RepID=A0A9W6MCD6_9ACTN|nr:hypothetical protein GCM10017600_27300 [Streptosporangium carneum]
MLALEVADDTDEVFQGTAEPVKGHHGQRVAGAQVLVCLLEARPVGVLAGRLVGQVELLDEPITS